MKTKKIDKNNKTVRILIHLVDHAHRWAGANPERGPTHRDARDRKDKLATGVIFNLADDGENGTFYTSKRLHRRICGNNTARARSPRPYKWNPAIHRK